MNLTRYFGFLHRNINHYGTSSLIFLDLARYGINRGYIVDSNRIVWIDSVYYYIERPYRIISSSHDEHHVQFDPIPDDQMAKIKNFRQKIIDNFPDERIGELEYMTEVGLDCVHDTEGSEIGIIYTDYISSSDLVSEVSDIEKETMEDDRRKKKIKRAGVNNVILTYRPGGDFVHI